MTADFESQFKAARFYLHHDGRGCIQWRLDVLPGWYVLATDLDGCSHYVDEGENWLVGLHSDDGFFECGEAETVEKAIALANAQAIAAHFVGNLEGDPSGDADTLMGAAFNVVTGHDRDLSSSEDSALCSKAWEFRLHLGG